MHPAAAEALLSVSSPHLPRLIDVLRTASREELVLAPGLATGTAAGGGGQRPVTSLAALLEERGPLDAGEAVTIALALARAIAALHAAGFGGVVILHPAVHLLADGRPMLADPGPLEHLEVLPDAVADDWRAFARFAHGLGLDSGPGAAGLARACAAVGAHEGQSSLAGLEDALFTYASPAPVSPRVRTREQPAEPEAPRGHALFRSASPAAGDVPAAGRAAARPRREARIPRRRLATAALALFEAGPGAAAREGFTRLRARFGTDAGEQAAPAHRRRVLLVAAAVAAAALLGALLLLPDGSHTTGPAPTGAGSAIPSAAADRSAVEQGAGPGKSAGPRGSDRTTAKPDPSHEPDPVRAAPVLLAARDECLRSSAAEQPSCFAAIADSASSRLDRPQTPLAGYTASLIERNGDTALIALAPPAGAQTPPASALLMRTEAGWRVRQLFAN